MASQITSISIVYSWHRSFVQAQIKETSKLRVTGLCEENSQVNFPHKVPLTQKIFQIRLCIMTIAPVPVRWLWWELVKWALIARFMGPTWGPSGADRTQVGPMLAPWTSLSGGLALTIAWYNNNHVHYSGDILYLWAMDQNELWRVMLYQYKMAYLQYGCRCVWCDASFTCIGINMIMRCLHVDAEYRVWLNWYSLMTVTFLVIKPIQSVRLGQYHGCSKWCLLSISHTVPWWIPTSKEMGWIVPQVGI